MALISKEQRFPEPKLNQEKDRHWNLMPSINFWSCLRFSRSWKLAWRQLCCVYWQLFVTLPSRAGNVHGTFTVTPSVSVRHQAAATREPIRVKLSAHLNDKQQQQQQSDQFNTFFICSVTSMESSYFEKQHNSAVFYRGWKLPKSFLFTLHRPGIRTL